MDNNNYLNNYLQVSRDQVKTWMQQVIAGVDNEQTHYSLHPQRTWSVWQLAVAANSHFDFTSGDAEQQLVQLALEVLGTEASQGDPNE